MSILLSVLFVLLGAGVLALCVWFASIPGHIARDRGHPQAQAITVCGYLGLLFLLPWLVAIVWAFAGGRDRGAFRSTGRPSPSSQQTCPLCSARIEKPYGAEVGEPIRCPRCNALTSIA